MSKPIVHDNMFLAKRVGLNHQQVFEGDEIKTNNSTFVITGGVSPNGMYPRGSVETDKGTYNPEVIKLTWLLVQPHINQIAA